MASNIETLPQAFEAAKAAFPQSLGPDKWYLVVASSLITNSDPSNLGKLWIHLVNQNEHQASDDRRKLNKRLREFVMKQWVTIGVPKAAIALFSLIQEEQPGDVDKSFTKSHAALTPQNRERGVDFLHYLYSEEQMAAMWNSWGKDFEWLTKDIVYGMFYADDTVLDNVETELINYTAIVSLGLKVTVHNHLGGLMNMGLTLEEIEGVTKCGRLIAEWAGVDTSSWPDVRLIAAEMNQRGGPDLSKMTREAEP